MRFKLKTPFFDFARDQVKGGVWYRPTWWDAVSNVPPVHFQPRIKKREVPAITFLEDRLVRCVLGTRGRALLARLARQRSALISLHSLPAPHLPNLATHTPHHAALR